MSRRALYLTKDGKHLTVNGVYHIATHILENTMTDRTIPSAQDDILDMMLYTDGRARLFFATKDWVLDLISSNHERIATREYNQILPCENRFSLLTQEVLDNYEVSMYALDIIEEYYPRIFE